MSLSESEFGRIQEINKQEEEMQKAFRILLDRQRQKAGHQVGMSSFMGGVRSFVTTASLSWAAQYIRFATELPIFNEYRDEFGKVHPNKYTQHLIQQRNPDWRRQVPMTRYLAARKNHKFPPLLVVVSQAWVNETNHDLWDANGKAMQDSMSYIALDSYGQFVDLTFQEGDHLYAIDGQHRLMAIKGLVELCSNGQLHDKQESGKAKTSGVLKVDDIIEESRGTIDRSTLQKLSDEKIGIELIPAVIREEAHPEALRRLRSVFVHVNRTAKPLSRGELALLDEDNGFAVVARRVMVEHTLLDGRVRLRGGQLGETSSDLTTLETLTTMSEHYLKPAFPKWKPVRGGDLPIRPEEEQLDSGYRRIADFFDNLSNLPSFKDVMHGASVSDYRKVGEDNPGNILFRPLGQIALAGAISDIEDDGFEESSRIFDKLREADREGRLKLDDVHNPWYGVAWDPVNKKMKRQGRDQQLVRRLLVHLLDGGTRHAEARNQLRTDFASARVFSDDEEKGRNLNGEDVSISEIQLPTPW